MDLFPGDGSLVLISMFGSVKVTQQLFLKDIKVSWGMDPRSVEVSVHIGWSTVQWTLVPPHQTGNLPQTDFADLGINCSVLLAALIFIQSIMWQMLLWHAPNILFEHYKCAQVTLPLGQHNRTNVSSWVGKRMTRKRELFNLRFCQHSLRTCQELSLWKYSANPGFPE